MILNLPDWFGPTLLAGLAVAAAAKGGRDERVAIAALLANVVLTRVLRDYIWSHVQWTEFALDVLFLSLLFAIALRSARYWPLFAAAFQLLVTLTHVAKLVDPTVNPWAYIAALVIWTYALMTSLGVGMWNNWRAERHLAITGPAPAAADTRR